MGISLKDTGIDLLGDKLYIEDRGHRIDEISWSPRIGITVAHRAPLALLRRLAHVSVSGGRAKKT